MHCSLQRTFHNSQKITCGGTGYRLNKFSEQDNSGASSRDCEVSSFVWRNSDQRCSILTFLALEPDGHWRVVTLPLQSSDHTNHLESVAQVKMDGLHLLSPSPVNSVKVDQHKAVRGTTTDRSCSVKYFTDRSYSGPNFQHQSRIKGLENKVSRWNQLPGNSSGQNSFKSNDSSGLAPFGSDAANSSDIHVATSKADKTVSRNSRKKARKKGRRNKKLSCETNSNELVCAHGCLKFGTGVNGDMNHRAKPPPFATALTMLNCNGNDLEGNRNAIIDCSKAAKRCTSSIVGVDVSEALAPSELQNFSGEDSLSTSETGAQTSCLEFSIFNGGVQDTDSKSTSCVNDQFSNVSTEPHDSSILDSVSVGSSSDRSINSYDFKFFNKRNCGTNHSEPSGYCNHLPRQNMLNGFMDSSFHVEGTKNDGQVRISGDIHSVVLPKRSKQIKRDSRNSSVYRAGSVGNFHGHVGKENYHTVWQKVQKTDANERHYGLSKVDSGCSLSNIGLKGAPPVQKNHNAVISYKLIEDKGQLKPKISRKLKGKTNPVSKQENNCYARKRSQATKPSSNLCMEVDTQQNALLDVSAQVSGKNGLASDSRSVSNFGCSTIGFQMNTAESISAEAVLNSQVCPNELEQLKNVYTAVSYSSNKTLQSQNSLATQSCDYLDQPELLEGQSAAYLCPHVGDETAKVENDVRTAENGKQDHGSVAILQKWVPVGIKDALLGISCHFNDSLDKSAANSWTARNITEELDSNPDRVLSSTNGQVLCMVQDPENCNNLPSEAEDQIEKMRNQSSCTSKEYRADHAIGRRLVHESEVLKYSSSENDSSEIERAVKDAYGAQLASEAFQIATGCPIAEFERLLHSATPVICPRNNIVGCLTCSHDGLFGANLCRHNKPNMSLGCLWKWYEKHGSYGLEVRAEDYAHSDRLGIDCSEFRAYFVPLLSAVQLFKNLSNHPSDNRQGSSGIEAVEPCNTDEITENSANIGQLPIFSTLIPQPQTENSSFQSPANHACCLRPSSVFNEDSLSIQSVDSACSGDLEVLYEYFEVEQPHHRRPLFEMIKELVSGDGPSQHRAYGDPTTLDLVDIHDLHPKSWYSVAWYPIYRIPDGNFRAAFLTYHSLGHLVHKSTPSDSVSVNTGLIAPVVGLQSYNAQGECWFEPRYSGPGQMTGNQTLNPSGILEERLRTLELTASLMARATVTKGNLTTVNRQPDYEFFLSRKC